MSPRPCLDLTPGSCGAAASGQDAPGGRPVCAEPRPGVLHLILSTVPSPQLPPHRSPVSPGVHHQIQGMVPATHCCLSGAPEGWEPAVTSLSECGSASSPPAQDSPPPPTSRSGHHGPQWVQGQLFMVTPGPLPTKHCMEVGRHHLLQEASLCVQHPVRVLLPQGYVCPFGPSGGTGPNIRPGVPKLAGISTQQFMTLNATLLEDRAGQRTWS